MKKLLLYNFLLFFSINFCNGQIKKYCFPTYTGTYIMQLYDDESGKAVYQLFDKYGNLQKTMQGEWIMRDEGIYGGPAYKIIISWTGLNTRMPDLKFIAQINLLGDLQGIIDNRNNIWNACR